MLVRSTVSPLLRAAMTGTGRRTLLNPSSNLGATFPIQGGVTSTRNFLLQSRHALRPSMISAALLTTQSNGSPVHAAASSLRSLSRKNTSIPPLPPGLVPHNLNNLGALAYFSSSGAPGKGGGGRMGWLGGAVGAGALLLGKGKYVLGALKIAKMGPLISMGVSIGAYSMFFGLPYAVGIVGLILVHETGHALVMMRYGIPFSPMVFLPFMGAVISMKEMPRDAYQDAMIAFGGPALGTAGAMGVAAAAQMTDSQLLYALADFGFLVNLFNMIPLGSMDGGRICGALSPYFGVAGLAGGAGLIYAGYIHNPLFYLIYLAGGWHTFQQFYDPAAHRPPHYYKITPTQRVLIGTSYVGLIGTLLTCMAVNAANKKSPEELKRYQELHFNDSDSEYQFE